MNLFGKRTILGRIAVILKGVNIHPAYLTIPIVLSLMSAAFEGMSVGLLIPMLNGFLTKDFSFVKNSYGLSTLFRLLPSPLTGSDKSIFGTLLTIFVVSVILKNVLKYLSIVCMYFYATRAHHHLRKKLFHRYLSFGKLYFDRTSTGHHSTVFSEFAYEAIRPIFRIDKYINAFFSLVVYLVVMATISWQLTLFALPIFAVLHFSVRGIMKKIQGFSHALAKSGSELGKKTVEILSNIALVKSYCTEKYEERRYSEISDRRAILDFRVSTIQEITSPIQEIITLVAAIILFVGMLYLMVREQTGTSSSFIVYFYIVLNASNKFSTLTNLRSILSGAVGSLQVIEDLLQDDGKEFVPGGEKEFSGLRQGIEFRNLSFVFPGGREVLSNISFSVAKGRMMAIVGPTGGGKTTLINLLMRFYDCAPSALIVDGVDIRDYSIPSLRRHIALVSQETLLLHDTLHANITYGLEKVSPAEVEKAIDRSRLRDFVSQLPEGTKTLIGDRGVKLSGGEKQRVSIARALLKGAEILILDEATSSLDSSTERLIQEAIDEAVKEKTAIVIAHRLSTIKHADAIVVIDHGRIVEQGTREELIAANGKFRELWEQQKFV